jgi:type III secretion system FlhB-like substrate exporter
MMDALIQEAEEADVHLKQIQTLFDNLCEATDRCKYY